MIEVEVEVGRVRVVEAEKYVAWDADHLVMAKVTA